MKIVHIDKNTVEIDIQECINITDGHDPYFRVDKRNLVYYSQNGSLFEKNGTILFAPMHSQTEYYMPDEVYTIYAEALACSEYSCVYLNDVMNIGDFAFDESGIEIVEGRKVEFIGVGAFRDCIKLKTAIFPSVHHIEKLAFYGSGVESISFPSTLEYIAEDAFRYCENLKEIYFDGQKKNIQINELAFADTNIEKVFVPSGFEIDQKIFGNARIQYC